MALFACFCFCIGVCEINIGISTSLARTAFDHHRSVEGQLLAMPIAVSVTKAEKENWQCVTTSSLHA